MVARGEEGKSENDEPLFEGNKSECRRVLRGEGTARPGEESVEFEVVGGGGREGILSFLE